MCIRDRIVHGQSLDEATLDIMAEKGIALCPTINFMPAWLETFPPKYDPELHDKYEGATVAEKDLNRIYDLSLIHIYMCIRDRCISFKLIFPFFAISSNTIKARSID